jgi:hypothetical protein
VSTERCSIAWSLPSSLGASLTCSRSAESWIGVSGFLISWARRRATSLHASTRCARDELGDVVEDHQPRPQRHRRAAHQQGDRRPLGAAGRPPGLQLERVLPVVALARLGAGRVHLEALPHRLAERADAGHLLEPATAVGRERQAQDPGRAGLTVSIAPLRSKTITPAVRLSRMVCRLARAPSTWTTLFCTSSRASASCASSRRTSASGRPARRASEHGLRAEVAARQLLDPLASTSSGCASWLLRATASSSAPNTAEHQGQGQRADVHLAQAGTRQRPLLGIRR